MKTITASAAKNLGRFLAKDFRQIFGSAYDETAERISSLARSTIECLGRSDALYHNLEHTLLVTMVGRDILQGFSLSHRIKPTDYSVSSAPACCMTSAMFAESLAATPRPSSSSTRTTQRSRPSWLQMRHSRLITSTGPRCSRLSALAVLVDATRVADAIELTRFPARIDQTAETVIERTGGRRFDRTTRRSDVFPKSKRSLLRIRRDRDESTTWLFLAGGYYR